MRTAIWLAVAAYFTSASIALILTKRNEEGPAVIAAPIQRRRVPNPLRRDRVRRQNIVTQELDNLDTLYFADIAVGTPPQNLRVHLDTGSSDLWVNTRSSNLCQSARQPCEEYGTYEPDSSSTYTYLNSDFVISYLDGSGASGDYVTDTISIGGAELADAQFAVGYQSNSQEGVLGIGYPLNEVQVLTQTGGPYANLPALLAERGYIRSSAYSLWLNDLDSSTGLILFGGVDTEKYIGELRTLPIIAQEGGAYTEFSILMTAISRGGSIIRDNLRIRALLDSGTSFTYLPVDITAEVYESLGAVYNSETGEAYVDCDLAGTPDTLDFTFSSATIAVPMNEIVIPVRSSSAGQGVCILGISVSPDESAILGDTFLRSAYVVYDLANNEISIAQTDFNETQSNILEITNEPDGVPNAIGLDESRASRAANGVSALCWVLVAVAGIWLYPWS